MRNPLSLLLALIGRDCYVGRSDMRGFGVHLDDNDGALVVLALDYEVRIVSRQQAEEFRALKRGAAARSAARREAQRVA